MPAEAHVRGSLLVHLRAHVVERLGEPAWTRAAQQTLPADREELGGLMITGSWYRVALWNHAWRAYVATTGADPATEMLAVSKRVADADLHTLFKLTLKLASPSQIVQRSGWLWRRYFDVGGVTVHEEGPSRYRARLEAPNGDEEGPNDAICAHGVPGWLTQALKLSGAAKASVQHTRCRFTFSRYCEYSISW